MVKLSIVTGGDHMLARADQRLQVSHTVTRWFCHQAGVPIPDDPSMPT
jgi:hypothetical protein